MMSSFPKISRGRSLVIGILLVLPALASAETYFSDGAEGYTSAADAVSRGPWTAVDQSGGTAGPSKNYAHTGTQSIRVCYSAQEAQAYMEIQLPQLTHVFFRWWELREKAGDFSGSQDYDWSGEKFNRLRSATIGSTGVDYPLGWTAKGGGFGSPGVTDSGPVQLFGNSTASNGSDLFSVDYAMTRGQWHMFELELNLGSSGSSNGAARLWIDDKLMVERTGVNLLPKNSATIDRIWVGGWYSGAQPATNSCRYIDDIVVASSKIGGTGAAPAGPTPSTPTGVRVN